MIRFFYLFVFSLLVSLTGNASDNFIRYPALNADGTNILFTYQGDVWMKQLNNEAPARRLTIHEAYDSYPKWSPDGKQISFTSNRSGHNDVYTMDLENAFPKRLTYHETEDVAWDWSSNDEILFMTSRVFRQVEREYEFYKVSTAGETPHRNLDAMGSYPVVSPNKRFIAFTRGWCRTAREDYRGAANRDIWVYDTETKTYTQITTHQGNDFMPDWVGNNTLYFISARSGRYNIHKVALDDSGKKSGDITAVTNYKDHGIRYFDVSADGQTISFERDINIYLQKGDNGTPTKLNMNLTRDYRLMPEQYKTYTKGLTDYVLSPNKKMAALVIHGELFLIRTDLEKSRTVRLTNHSYRDMDPQWLNDSTLVFISDREGQKEIYLLKSADDQPVDLYKSLQHNLIRLTHSEEHETGLAVAPKENRIAFTRGTGNLIVATVDAEKETLTGESTLLDGWATPSDISWSPDAQWLAYTLPDLYFNYEIYIHPFDDDADPVNVSMHPGRDYDPVWANDGSKLAFVSTRNNNDADVWFVWLKKEDWEKTRLDWQEEETDEPKKDKKEDEEDKTITIDFENIHDRLQQVTALPGNESNPLISEDGKTFYFVANRNSRQQFKADQDIYSINWDGTEMKRITQGNQSPGGLEFDAEKNRIYFAKRGGILMSVGVNDSKIKSHGFKAMVKIDRQEELEQIFEEAWSVLDDRFYDPDFHGQDWNALKATYKPWALAASTKEDFRDMFNLMLGQVNASHMGLYGRSGYNSDAESTGLLGIECRPHKKGVEITHVVPETPADKTVSKLNTGDVITMVNSTPLTASTNLYSLLINSANEEILLNVENRSGDERIVTIRPTGTVRNELYNEWVDERKALTEKYSNGKLGYIHIQAMGWSSFEEFQRELMATGYNKEGIIIDVRFNGGGWTTDYLMATLDVRQHAYTIPRGAAENLSEEHQKFKEYYPYSERLPFPPVMKPTIALCNENSYSNAEIFSHAYKNLDLGTLVGTPTFGAVISTGGYTLIDNSYIRLPGRGWYVKASGGNMEFEPATPDIIVHNAPNYKGIKEDKQLKTAVDELLKQLGE
ncbi:MAG: S41 family peptidase [Bacteroidota bacterium]